MSADDGSADRREGVNDRRAPENGAIRSSFVRRRYEPGAEEMFFARVRWVGRILDGAGIDSNSKMGRDLSTTLIKFSKYCQEKNRRGEGALGVRLDLGPAEWAVLGAIVASEEPRVADHVAEALALSHSDAVSLITRTQKSALELAEREMPELLLAGE